MSIVTALPDRYRLLLGERPIRRSFLLLVTVPLLLMGGEALVRARLEAGPRTSGIARVYGRPLTLRPGEVGNAAGVRRHLERLGYRRAPGRGVGIGEFYFGPRGWILGRRASRGWGRTLPAGFAVVRLGYGGRILRMEDQDGRRLSRFVLEPELLGRTGHGPSRDRIPVDLDEIPAHLVEALLTAEDQRFFQHPGVDLRRIGGAFSANVKAGKVVQGGSTLTQQLAKNLFLDPRRTLIRKSREAMMALTLEMRHTKEEILRAYLNHVYLGQDGAVAIHGVGRAAHHFFGKDVVALRLEESALLVALIRAPSLYSPFRHPEVARKRRDLVLRLMLDRGLVTEGEYEEARKAPLGLRSSPPPVEGVRYFLDFVVKTVEEEVRRGPLVTTLDPGMQEAAAKAVREGLAELERHFDWLRESDSGEPLQAALVALDPRTGAVLAMMGGRDYGISQFNRAVDARRQPGSAFKPVVALSALAGPEPSHTLASILDDEPLRVETPTGSWQPANYDGSFRGRVTLREALEGSLNVPFARLGMAVGPGRIVETARQMGIQSPLDPFPSLALGASEVTLLELTRAFGVLAAGGYLAGTRVLHPIRVEDREAEAVSGDGGTAERVPGSASVEDRQAFAPAEAYLVTSALQGAVERGTGRAIREEGYKGVVAAKSGTTNDFRDGWFVGYTPTLAVGVWVGFDHGHRLELPGSSVALPIFTRFLREVAGTTTSGRGGREGVFPFPSGLEVVEVDLATGLRGGWGCRGEPELFLRGTAPREACNGFRMGDGFHVDEPTLRFLLEQGGAEVGRLIRRLLEGDGHR